MRARSVFAGAAAGAVLALGLAGPSQAQACHGAPTPFKLVVVVTGVRSDHGRVAVTVYGDDPRKFLDDAGEVASWSDPAHAGDDTLCTWLPAAGAYALIAYHDAN